jgi:hypothetical protein
MKNLIFNFDVNDYPHKSDFIQIIRSFIRTVDKNPEFNLKDDMGRAPNKIFSLTNYLNGGDGEMAVLTILQKRYEKNELFKSLLQGYSGIQNDSILVFLYESQIGLKISVSDNTKLIYELRMD